ncbi:hypothetical protein NQD34_007600, partial [Periophthalmus magnuspinnatus]
SFSNIGALSLVSNTCTMMLAVPDRAGVPPSTAVRIKLWTACCSLSNVFVKINSANFDPSLPV